MTQTTSGHLDTALSVLLLDPLTHWEHWRCLEEGRDELNIDPRKLNESLELSRGQFDAVVVDQMSKVGRLLLRRAVMGEDGAGDGFQLCLTRWCELPYFTRTPEPVMEHELHRIFSRYPWFFYLMFTDPAL